MQHLPTTENVGRKIMRVDEEDEEFDGKHTSNYLETESRTDSSISDHTSGAVFPLGLRNRKKLEI